MTPEFEQKSVDTEKLMENLKALPPEWQNKLCSMIDSLALFKQFEPYAQEQAAAV